MASLSYQYNTVTTACTTIAAVTGPVSGATYSMNDQDSANSILTKINADGSHAYSLQITGFLSTQNILVPSNDETYIYGIMHAAFSIFQFDATNGTPLKAWSSTTYSTSNVFPHVLISNDDSTIYFTAFDTGDNKGVFCSFVVTGTTTYQCHKITEMTNVDMVLQLGSANFFISGRGFTNNSLKMMKFTFGTINPVWNKDITCDSTG
jgi:hypothetical protein